MDSKRQSLIGMSVLFIGKPHYHTTIAALEAVSKASNKPDIVVLDDVTGNIGNYRLGYSRGVEPKIIEIEAIPTIEDYSQYEDVSARQLRRNPNVVNKIYKQKANQKFYDKFTKKRR